MQRKLNYLFILLLCFSCKSKPIDLGMATPYFPSAELLQEGFVYKYYAHRVPKNKNSDPATDIRYRKFQTIYPDILEISVYDAAYELRWYYKYQVSQNKFRIMDSYAKLKGDTIYPKCRKNVEFDWANQAAISDCDINYSNNATSNLVSFQTGIKDTILNENLCKFISKKDSTSYVSNRGDTSEIVRNYVEIFETGKGYIGQISDSERYTTTYELVEKMSLPEFRRRSKHNLKRIAYIDPAKTLDDHSDFKLCNNEQSITDYNSCKERAQLKGGKGSWWRILRKKLNPKKLKNESGYLTYRFVINCEGASGRFVVESADLDFNRKEFDTETVEHLYDIVSKERDWEHCHGNYYNLDAYAYITFKLKNGEIIELLP